MATRGLLTLEIADNDCADPVLGTLVGGIWSTLARSDRPRAVPQPTVSIQDISQLRSDPLHPCREIILCALLPFKGIGGACRYQQRTSKCTKALPCINLLRPHSFR